MAKREKGWDERFRVIRPLGAGAFGRTLLVSDTHKNNRQVVIKVPHDKKTEEALINDLVNGAALTALSHPNVVRCLGFGTFEGYYVMILEFVEGRDLRRIIGPMHLVRRPMELPEALGIFSNTCSGLVTAHKINLLHRDIKPDNILVRDGDGIAKLSDFGISTIMQSNSVGSGTVAGTFPYMAPEALAGRSSFQSDIWSLGVTLYEMVTGRLPFWNENLFALKQKIDNEEPAAPVDLNPEVDERLNAVIVKALQKDPKARFTSAQDMLDALGPDIDSEIAELRRVFRDQSEDTAEKQARALLERSPQEPRIYMLLGEFCNRRQQFQAAEQIVREGIKRCPEHAGLHFYLAPALWCQGGKKRQQAISTLQRAIELGLSPAQDKQAHNLLTSWKATGGAA